MIEHVFEYNRAVFALFSRPISLILSEEGLRALLLGHNMLT